MNHIYILPGHKCEPVYLGENFEHLPHFHYPNDAGKKNRTISNMFTRGQFFEYLLFLYHETGDNSVLETFKTYLTLFQKEYPLMIEDTTSAADRFMYQEDRTVMSVGWLCMVYTNLLYSEMLYQLPATYAFDVLKRIWFIGMQFTRFDSDSFHPHNHHLWERGLVPFILGTVFPEIPAFKAMQSIGAAVVCEHIHHDFNASGGYSEHSFSYTYGAVFSEMIYRGMRLSTLNHAPLFDGLALEKLNKSFDLLALITPPTSHYITIGDGGKPTVNPLLKLGKDLFQNESCRQLLDYRTQVTNTIDLPLYYFNEHTGYSCGRTGYSKDASYFLMSTKINCNDSGHNHMDMLSLCYHVNGKPIFDEPYGAVYSKSSMNTPQRGFYYNMGAHNTVLAYGKPILPDSIYQNLWGVYRSDSPIEDVQTTPYSIYLKASHSGYTFCKHTREVTFHTSTGNLVVRDSIQRGNRFDSPHIQRWHLSPNVVPQIINDHCILLTVDDTQVLCTWSQVNELKLWKNSNLLCPDIYASEDELGYVIEVVFSNKQSVVTLTCQNISNGTNFIKSSKS